MADIKKAIKLEDGTITNLIDGDSKQSVNYKPVSKWYDNTDMTNDKVDGRLYIKNSGVYYRQVIERNGELFLEKDTVAEFKNISNYEILLIKAGVYKGVKLNGYYTLGDTPTPINYVITNTANNENGGSIIQANGVKFFHNFDKVINCIYYGTIQNSSTINTARIQLALNSVSAVGCFVEIPLGCYFNLQDLTFPIKVDMSWYKTDDRSRPSLISSTTNELVTFVANANVSGIVNEQQLSAAFHIGHVLDIRDDVAGQDGWLGAGQTRENPARASYNIRRQGLNKFRIVYQHYKNRQLGIDNGTTFQPWRTELLLEGVSATSFTNPIAIGDFVEGSTSKGYGSILAIEANAIRIVLDGYKFDNGEALKINGETSTTTITNQTPTVNKPLPVLSVDDRTGYWGFGVPSNEARSLLTVGGRLTVAPTRTAGQHVEDIETNSILSFSPSINTLNYVPTEGFDIVMDNSKAIASRRLTINKRKSNIPIGHIGAVRCHGSFSNTALVGTSSFNIKSIVKNAIGDYTINFITPFNRADYTIAFSTANPMEFPYVYIKAVGTIKIRIATTGTATLVDPTGLIGITCTGGDI